ncbi:MAG: WD40 repeat domain-containing protein [bacterium]
MALAACDGGEPSGGDDGGVCNAASLIAQCPAGSSPVIGAQAEASCAGGEGLVQDADGATSGQCVGPASCRALCQLAVPCRCGVQQVTADAIICAPCDGAAACGDGVCAGGEDPATCPVDCGARCEPDEVRCDGVVLEACSLQGRWERLPCPAGEVCVADGGQARCDRDPQVIGGGDASVGDGGAPPADERILPGAGTWPRVADRRAGQSPPGGYQAETFTVALTQGPGNEASDFARSRQAVGTCFEHRLGPAPDTFECWGPAGWFRADFQGHPVPVEAEDPIDSEAFCAAVTACEGTVIDDCAAEVAAWRARLGELRLRCVAAAIPADCLTLAGIGCDVAASVPYPDGARFMRGAVVRAGARVIGVLEDATTAAWIDGDGVRRLVAPGELRLTQAVADLGGDVAAFLGQAGTDEAILLWTPASDERRLVLARGVGHHGRLALGPDAQVLAARLEGDPDPRLNQGLSLYNLAEDQRIFSILPAGGDRLGDAFAFSPDGRHLAVAVEPGGRVELWDVATRQKRHTLAGPAGSAPQALAFSPDGRYLAVLAGPLSLWEVDGGRRVQTVDLAVPAQGGVTFEADGQRALLGGGVARRADFTVLRP